MNSQPTRQRNPLVSVAAFLVICVIVLIIAGAVQYNRNPTVTITTCPPLAQSCYQTTVPVDQQP